MTIYTVTGDPLLTSAQYLAFGYNRLARTEMSPLEMRLVREHPTAFATFGKQARQARIESGDIWLWTESRPRLLFMVVRESSVGATRVRYFHNILLKIAREHRLMGLKSLTICPIGQAHEWQELQRLITPTLKRADLTVIIYDHYQEGVRVDESAFDGMTPPSQGDDAP